MNTTFVTEAAQQHDLRAHSILLHPRGQGFWWLLVEPPLYVVAAGIVFVLVVARPLLADLERHRATTR